MFIFQPGCFEAEGVLKLTSFPEEIPFLMKWHIFHQEGDEIECCQEIQIKGFTDILYNQYTFSNLKEKNFTVTFENINLGRIEGVGVKENQFIGWEFRNVGLDYEGYEYYEQTGEYTYNLNAAFTASDNLRTEIRGSINRKTAEQTL